ncbi:hypothetical protein [Neorickettsia sennetsu]|uniref:Uncharacterized protein n=1 Tax=Ehrlichia sennetsu (strain ATCC VR-367 / Miyayama) TaxID=222891 RepID=Q2GCV2_EHRS3|nr:hypothetical protein [Neorickettsia sennetsu]ABD45775.1 hypothetical protein NSE_0823 [Neorickettsia sennetsu str. Miyayama]
MHNPKKSAPEDPSSSDTSPPTRSSASTPSSPISASTDDRGGSGSDGNPKHDHPYAAPGPDNLPGNYEPDLAEVYDYCRTILTCETGGNVNEAWNWLEQTSEAVLASSEFKEECRNLNIALPPETEPTPQRSQPRRRAAEGVRLLVRGISTASFNPPESKHRKLDTTSQDDGQPSTSGASCAAVTSKQRRSSGSSSDGSIDPTGKTQTTPRSKLAHAESQSHSSNSGKGHQ